MARSAPYYVILEVNTSIQVSLERTAGQSRLNNVITLLSVVI